jgi:hypothetical protein
LGNLVKTYTVVCKKNWNNFRSQTFYVFQILLRLYFEIIADL